MELLEAFGDILDPRTTVLIEHRLLDIVGMKLTHSIADTGAQLFCPITVWLIKYVYHQEHSDVSRYGKETSTSLDR